MQSDSSPLRAHVLVLAMGALAVNTLPVFAGPGAKSGKGPKAPPTTSGIQTFQGEQAPAAPSDLRVEPTLTGGFRVTWKDNATNETAYEVERSPAFSGGLMRMEPDAVGFMDSQDLESVQYHVRAAGVTLKSDWTSWVQGVGAAAGFEILMPGPGFGGETAQSLAVGTPNMAGYDAKAIARWDVVPYQTFAGNFYVGVVGFHMNGIDRVEFSANGGPWTAVREMRRNPLSDVWEYTALMRAGDFTEGPVEVRAIVYPRDAGQPRLLEPIRLFASKTSTAPAEVFVSPSGDDASDGSREHPFRSIFRAGMALQQRLGGKADGGVISLLAGDHDWGRAGYDSKGQYIGNLITSERWLEIRPASGLERSDVRITTASAGGLKTSRIHLKGVTLQVSPTNSIPSGSTPALWLDQCAMVGTSPTVDVRWTPATGYPAGIFVTESQVTGGRYGFVAAKLVRNVAVEGTGDDAFTNNQMVINASVRGLTIPNGSGFHADIVQLHASATPQENVIVYNLRAVDCAAQPWHVGYTGHVPGPNWSAIAFVNVQIENELPGQTAQWCVSANHLLWWHLGITGAPVILRDTPVVTGQQLTPTVVRNLRMQNCILEKFIATHTSGIPALDDTTWASNNHFVDTNSHGALLVGASATSGGELGDLYVDRSANDFRAAAPFLLGRLLLPIVPVDAAQRPVADAIGPLQP